MDWQLADEKSPMRGYKVLIRYVENDDSDDVSYAVAWLDAGLWWLNDRVTLSCEYFKVTHWATIQPPVNMCEVT